MTGTDLTTRERELLGPVIAAKMSELSAGMTAGTYADDIASPSGRELLEWQAIASKVKTYQGCTVIAEIPGA